MSIIKSNMTAPPPAAAGGGGSLSSIGEMNSLRFDGTASLTKRMDQNSNASKFTYSVWLKKMPTGQQGNEYINFFQACQNYPYYSEYAGIGFRESGALYIFQFDGRNIETALNGNYSAAAAPYFRDYSAWYHIVTSYNSADGWVKNYVNGTEVANYNYSSTAYCFLMNSSKGREVNHSIGGYWHNPGSSWAHKNHYHGYMSDIYLIDGAALEPTAFADRISDIWVPKQYGSGDPTDTATVLSEYGTNGFHLDFADSANIGNDASGRGNHWTVH